MKQPKMRRKSQKPYILTRFHLWLRFLITYGALTQHYLKTTFVSPFWGSHTSETNADRNPLHKKNQFFQNQSTPFLATTKTSSLTFRIDQKHVITKRNVVTEHKRPNLHTHT